MKLTYIGTAAAEAIPGLFCECSFCENARRVKGRELRRRSGAVIDNDLMIDFSPDAYTGTLSLGIRLNELRYLLFTHSHADHFCVHELEYRRTPVFCVLPEDREKLKVYGNRNIESGLKNVFGDDLSQQGFEFSFVFPYVPFHFGDYTVTPLSVIHNPPEDAYIYLIEKGGVKLLYANDSGMFPEKTFEYLKGIKLDIISLDCTLGHSPHATGHMGFSANLKVKEILVENGCVKDDTVFVSHHFSHNGLRADNPGEVDWTYENFMEMAKPHGFIMSYDGLVIEK
ncbi:MAG: hypothetical protein IJT49_08905 [Clostridia bacterium]|nr:hypothetical protein [Clostridia bacterium]